MKKTLKYALALIILSSLSFGGGIGLAHLRINTGNNPNFLSKVSLSLPSRSDEKPPGEATVPESIQTAESRADISAPSRESSPLANQPGDAENKFSFVVIGDTQSFRSGGNGGFQRAVRQIRGKDVSAVVSVGDLVSSCDGTSGCESKLSGWINALGDLAARTYVVQGNHDRVGREKADKILQEFFSMPTNGPAGYSEFTYSFDLKNAHFVVLDSDKPDEHVINKTQRNWLEQDLSKNTKPYTFVFFHEPAYPVSSKIGESLDVKPGERDALWGIFARHKVTAVFFGHEHIASRKNISGVYQFGFGNTDSFNHDAPKPGVAEWSYVGQSFGVVNIGESGVTVNVFSVDGKLLNSFAIPK
jgi:predicted phosphodiesterase